MDLVEVNEKGGEKKEEERRRCDRYFVCCYCQLLPFVVDVLTCSMVEWEMAEMRHMPLMDITKLSKGCKRVNGKKGRRA